MSRSPRASTPEADIVPPGEMMFRRQWTFVKSVPALEFLPDADRPEVALAGRSNVGKSSLINAIVGQHGLARTSNTPGRTQELNFFIPADVALHLVDMPGYGFAEAPKTKVEEWTLLVKDYLRGRPTLKRVFLLIDSRHGVKPNDEDIMELLDAAAVIYQVILTKSDKISMAALAKVEAATRAVVAKHPAAYPEIIVTSSEKKIGIDLIQAEIATIALPGG